MSLTDLVDKAATPKIPWQTCAVCHVAQAPANTAQQPKQWLPATDARSAASASTQHYANQAPNTASAAAPTPRSGRAWSSPGGPVSDKPCSEFCPFSACHACPWKGGKCLSDQVPPTTLYPHPCREGE